MQGIHLKVKVYPLRILWAGPSCAVRAGRNPLHASALPGDRLSSPPRQVQALIYLQLSIGGQATIFVARTRSFFFSQAPGRPLLLSFVFAQIVSTLLTVYVRGFLNPLIGLGMNCGTGEALAKASLPYSRRPRLVCVIRRHPGSGLPVHPRHTLHCVALV